MIREHEFNSRWWGARVGFLEDSDFFSLSRRRQDELCSAYAWVEYAAPIERAPAPQLLLNAGFCWVDTQIPFRISLGKIDPPASARALSATSAAQQPFEISASRLRSFVHERYHSLPGVTAERVNERYALWSNDLVEKNPDWCVQITDDKGIQGWFLSEERDGNPLNLTLAMLHSEAHISGYLLYQRAMLEYAARGIRLGAAAFSVANTSVLNIYASLGARFLSPKGYWIRGTADRANPCVGD